jgi:hypothetical protein
MTVSTENSLSWNGVGDSILLGLLTFGAMIIRKGGPGPISFLLFGGTRERRGAR